LGFALPVFLQQFIKSAPFVFAVWRDNPKTDYLAQTAESVGGTFLIHFRLELFWFVRKRNRNQTRAIGYADAVGQVFWFRCLRHSLLNPLESPPKSSEFSGHNLHLAEFSQIGSKPDYSRAETDLRENKQESSTYLYFLVIG
jgi:hypothetical protein